MNLRNVGDYNISFDIGTNSVGWCVTDSKGALCHFNKKPTWGSRLFPEAQKAAEARVHRGQRRRYDRRRQRLDLLQGLFASEMNELDPELFIRLNQSRLLKEDRQEGQSEHLWPFFNNEDFTEVDYYEKFPTIYHLRHYLTESDEKADLRLIYLAFHNIVKHRGNFLQQDNKTLCARNASVDDSIEEFCYTLAEWCEAQGILCSAEENCDQICEVLKQTQASKTQLREQVVPLLGLQVGENADQYDKNTLGRMAKALAGSLVGAKSEFAHVFYVVEEKPESVTTNIYLSKDDQVEALEEALSDESLPLFNAVKRVYSSYVLQEILSMAPNQTISANKVKEYEKYRDDLRTLKDLVREYCPDKYNEFFRGELYEKLYPGEKPKYNVEKAAGYTLYNEMRKRSYDDFRKDVEKLFAGTEAVGDSRYLCMMEEFENERFLRRLKTSDNGAIPFQLHLEEMNDIIDRQKKYYPFLEADRDKLNSLVSFRIPYYVGPLTRVNARKANDKEDGEPRFAWSVRLEGKENEKIYPWNWEEIIDKNESAERFIKRMTGMCTYLQGEPVLPKCSLLYEEFCVRNELNGAHYTEDRDKSYRFDYSDRDGIFEDLFKNGSVSYSKVNDWMAKNRNNSHVHTSGGQGDKGFESRLSSYLFFKKDVFGVDEIPESDYPMIEQIILWNTLFEDRDILRQKLKETYGDRLDDAQIKRICQKRFTGWGKLSKKFLTGIKTQTDNGEFSLMDILREGNQNNGQIGKAMVLMEALRDDKLDFQGIVDSINAEKMKDGNSLALEDLPGSPAIRRSINQVLSIADEIVGIVGHAPNNIYIEVARSDDEDKKGKRTTSRKESLKAQLKSLKDSGSEFWNQKLDEELKEHGGNLTEKLTLYFMQGGKSLYSGKPLDIDQLSKYQVDHILPQSYIKDDSYENKALVLAEENQRKSDQMLLPQDVRTKMKSYWRALHDAKLIGDKKFNNLLRSEIRDKQLKGFINRQIVETSQSIKTVQTMLKAKYPDTQVVSVKADLSHELREKADFPKCREANDFHHAHDALLACQIGRFIQLRYPEMHENPLKYQHLMRRYIQDEQQHVKSGHMPYGTSFVMSSFMKTRFDKETGEIFENGDIWDADFEIARIRKYLNYRQCYISRMPEETSGAFWDATIYSPHDGKKKDQLKLPLKKGLDPKKYGSYSREQFAYFFVYEAESKGKSIFEFAPVPVSVAAALASDPSALEVYAQGLAQEVGSEFRRVVRSKIYKYQLIETQGSRLYITGKKEVRNGIELAFDQYETGILARIVLDLDEEKTNKYPATDEEIAYLYDCVCTGMKKYAPRLASALKIGEWDLEYAECSLQDKEKILLSLIAITNAKTNMINLAAMKLGKALGCMRITFEKLASESGVDIIDQSVTGMFERRTHIGL